MTGLRQKVHGFVVAALLERSARSVVDAGCGTGWYTRKLHDKGFEAIGIDRSRWKIALAALANGGPTYLHADFTSAQRNRFDAVVCIGVLHSIRDCDLDRYLLALRSLASASGAIVIADIDATRAGRPGLGGLLLRADEALVSLIDPGHYAAFRDYVLRNDLERRLGRHGLRPEQRIQLSTSVYGLVCTI